MFWKDVQCELFISKHRKNEGNSTKQNSSVHQGACWSSLGSPWHCQAKSLWQTMTLCSFREAVEKQPPSSFCSSFHCSPVGNLTRQLQHCANSGSQEEKKKTGQFRYAGFVHTAKWKTFSAGRWHGLPPPRKWRILIPRSRQSHWVTVGINGLTCHRLVCLD